MRKNNGIRITIDGNVGAHKTAFVNALAEFLRERGMRNVEVLAEQPKDIVLGLDAMLDFERLVGSPEECYDVGGALFRDKQVVIVERSVANQHGWEPKPHRAVNFLSSRAHVDMEMGQPGMMTRSLSDGHQAYSHPEGAPQILVSEEAMDRLQADLASPSAANAALTEGMARFRGHVVEKRDPLILYSVPLKPLDQTDTTKCMEHCGTVLGTPTSPVVTLSKLSDEPEAPYGRDVNGNPVRANVTYIKTDKGPMVDPAIRHDWKYAWHHSRTGESRLEMLNRAEPTLIKKPGENGIFVSYENIPDDLIFDPRCGLRWKTDDELNAEVTAKGRGSFGDTMRIIEEDFPDQVAREHQESLAGKHQESLAEGAANTTGELVQEKKTYPRGMNPYMWHIDDAGLWPNGVAPVASPVGLTKVADVGDGKIPMPPQE